MPKLLQINSTVNWGSTGKIAEQIGTRAMANGWESYIAYGRYANPSQSKIIKIGSKWSLFLHLIESILLGNHGLASRVATKKLIKQIEKIKPDIIHLHNIHGYYINYKILFEYLNSTNIPVVWTLHDCWSFTGHCAHFDCYNCEAWKIQCQNCPALNAYPKTIIDTTRDTYILKKDLFVKNNNLYIVPVSLWLESFIRNSFLKDKKIQTIHNGIDLSAFSPQPPKGNISANTILGVASQWSKQKGLDDFIIMRKLLPEDKYNIILIGLNDKQIKNLPTGITGIRRTQNTQELAQYYSSATVFINPTYSDNYPTTNLEAMACGTPVITYRTGGSPESICNETGFVVEQGDVSGIITAIQEIEAKGKDFYSDKCRKHAMQYFDKDKCFAKYIQLYNEILNNSK